MISLDSGKRNYERADMKPFVEVSYLVAINDSKEEFWLEGQVTYFVLWLEISCHVSSCDTV